MSFVSPVILTAALAAKVITLAGALAAGYSGYVVKKETYDVLKQMENDVKGCNLTEENINLLKRELNKVQEYTQNSEFVTTINSKDILIETVEEYGDFEITDLNGTIVCASPVANIEFYKTDENEPYIMKIKSIRPAEELAQDISEEYGLKVQEENYAGLIERLQEENIEIESEEVLEDDTIVLTINVE